MKRASAMRVIYFYETSRLSEPLFPRALLEQGSVPISLMAMSVSYRGDRWRLSYGRLSHDEHERFNEFVP